MKLSTKLRRERRKLRKRWRLSRPTIADRVYDALKEAENEKAR